MHLLNTTTKKLESFYSEDAPRYAILSHMWGKDEDEVTFNHMTGSDDARRKGERRKGYAKIEGACKQAIEDGFEYIWIDTCCINKESSVELSEAINSMYKWYERAEVCYVYLEDVESSRRDKDNLSENVQMDGNDDDSPFKIAPFKDSRWFSRGWTLQELIAPRYIVFYSKDWIDIGTKASLRSEISATTRIRVEMLMAYNPKKASVAEKMSWAAFRETTREEDIAYCLMGLFGVNMPLLYGEGNKAFRRLQEEIMKESDDHSLFAWKAGFNPGRRKYKTRGMLADSPWEFRDGMDIIPSSDGAYSPYSMTNQGLQIQLPLESIDPKRDKINIDPDSSKNMFKTTLKCTIRNKKDTRWVVIYLKMIRKGYYQRIFLHWLDETEINPNENELTSLLVPQVQVITPVDPYFRPPSIRILPTKCGFTVGRRSLVRGYESHATWGLEDKHRPEVTVFDGRDGSCFAMVFGVHNGLPWLDIIDVDEELRHPQKRDELKDEIKKDYEKGGYRRNAVLRNLDRLSANISKNWLMVVSVKKIIKHKDRFPSLCATVDIQHRWYNPPLTSTSANSFGDFSSWSYEDSYEHPDFTKEQSDSIVVFNPKAKVVDVNLIHNINSHLPTSELRPFSEESHVRFSPDGKYLALVFQDMLIRVCETNTGAEICLLSDEMKSVIERICFSPDSKFLAVSTFTQASMSFEPYVQIKLWDIEKKHICKVSSAHHLDDIGFCDRYYLLALCFSPDGRLIIYGSGDGTIRIWDIIANKSEILTVDTEPDNIEFSRDGRLVAVLSDKSIVRIWDVATKRLVKRFKVKNKNYSHLLVFTPDKKGLLIEGGGELEYWNIDELVSAQVEGAEGSNGAKSVNGPRASSVLDQGETRRQIISEDIVYSIPAVSHDAHWVIFGSRNGSVLFCDLKDATTQFVLHWGDWSTFSSTSVDMSPVGNIFATGSKDGTVRIWSYDTASEE